MIKAVIFDFFGVIGMPGFDLGHSKLDDSTLYNVNKLIDKLEVGLINQDEYYGLYENLTGLSIPTQLKNDLIYINKVSISKQMIDLIENIKARGYKTALLSNVSEKLYEEVIKTTIADDLFDASIFSFNIHLIKPDPNIFIYTARKLNENPVNCLMIDDLELNCEGANKAGMTAIRYKNYRDLVDELNRINIVVD